MLARFWMIALSACLLMYTALCRLEMQAYVDRVWIVK